MTRSATGLDEIGSHPKGATERGILPIIAPGMEADLVATEGNPIDDITSVRKVIFVMKGGKVYKNAAR